MIISAGKITTEKGDAISLKDIETVKNRLAENSKVVTVKKVKKTQGDEEYWGPDIKAKSWRNLEEFETADSMTIEILEA